MSHQRAVDPVNLILHDRAFPIETAWNVIEHEGDEAAVPELTIPFAVENLMDPVDQFGF